MSETLGAVAMAGRKALERAQDGLVQDAGLEARWLLAHVTGLSRDRIILHLHDAATAEQVDLFWTLIDRRLAGQPISQLTGHRSFYGRMFHVTDAVLDPRPETETLVELALSEPFDTVLDLGTGSGCILATLLAERPAAHGMGTDISPEALEVATRNMAGTGVAGRVALRQGDWFAPVTGEVDLIVSNPPYITADAFAALDPWVREWEPKCALTPGEDGLASYRIICGAAQTHLVPGGRLMVEIGHDQGRDVLGLLEAAGFSDCRLHQDLGGKDRVVTGRHLARDG